MLFVCNRTLCVISMLFSQSSIHKAIGGDDPIIFKSVRHIEVDRAKKASSSLYKKKVKS